MRLPQSIHVINAPPHQHDSTIESERPQPYIGHAHFWERALSRRQVIRTAAVSAGTAVALSSGLLAPVLADATHTSSAPKPIPEVLIPGTPFHVLPPDSEEPSTIYDFNGFVGATEIQGHGSQDLLFDVDMRFMQGTYIGEDGRVHHGSFGFV